MPKTIIDAWCATTAAMADVAVAFCAVYVAVYLRFQSGWFEIPWGTPENVYNDYWQPALIASLLSFFILNHLKLYCRPQRGTFQAHIPRLVRGALLVTLTLLVLLSIIRNYTQISSGVIVIYFFVFALFLILERGILFRIELHSARKFVPTNCVLLIGTDATALRLATGFTRDPRLRVRVSGFLRVSPEDKIADGIPPDRILGNIEDFQQILDRVEKVVQVITVTHPADNHLLYRIASECERRLIRFNIVPDLFRILTSSVEVETIDDIPLLGLRRSPLDKIGNRILKRLEDIVLSFLLLLLSAPVIAVLALLIRRESPGPVFFGQTRCGYGNKPFTIWKLRSMRVDAEKSTGAVFAAEDDPRRTRIGAFMRSHNLDELPQFWNVLTGSMSLVGPRPERPEFVSQFSDEIAHYMRRHTALPGITGWAQVQGLRGNTSIEERLHADLWYLENWSFSLDFKILLRTLFAVRNAY